MHISIGCTPASTLYILQIVIQTRIYADNISHIYHIYIDLLGWSYQEPCEGRGARLSLVRELLARRSRLEAFRSFARLWKAPSLNIWRHNVTPYMSWYIGNTWDITYTSIYITYIIYMIYMIIYIICHIWYKLYISYICVIDVTYIHVFYMI